MNEETELQVDPDDIQPLDRIVPVPNGLLVGALMYKLAAAEWDVLSILMSSTYGRGVETARISFSGFSYQAARTREGITLAVKRLVSFGIIEVVSKAHHHNPTEYRIRHPSEWNWGESNARYIPDQKTLRPMVKLRPVESIASPAAHACALLLRQHSLELNPFVEVPDASLDDEDFVRWANYMERIIQGGYTQEKVETTIRWMHKHSEYWRNRCQGRRAAYAFSRYFGQIRKAHLADNRTPKRKPKPPPVRGPE